jgi:hypothetical protein
MGIDMTPRKHADLIKAWADGAEIEWYDSRPTEHRWKLVTNPNWYDIDGYSYRIKSEDVVKEFRLEGHSIGGLRFSEMDSKEYRKPGEQWIKVSFDADTCLIKNLEVIHE